MGVKFGSFQGLKFSIKRSALAGASLETGNLVVSGFGRSSVNKIYVPKSPEAGKPAFVDPLNSNNKVRFNGFNYEIRGIDDVWYISTNGPSSPELAVWQVIDGAFPIGTVQKEVEISQSIASVSDVRGKLWGKNFARRESLGIFENRFNLIVSGGASIGVNTAQIPYAALSHAFSPVLGSPVWYNGKFFIAFVAQPPAPFQPNQRLEVYADNADFQSLDFERIITNLPAQPLYYLDYGLTENDGEYRDLISSGPIQLTDNFGVNPSPPFVEYGEKELFSALLNPAIRGAEFSPLPRQRAQYNFNL